MTLVEGDVLKATWTSGGAARESTFVVGGEAPAPAAALTTTAPTPVTQSSASSTAFVETFTGNSGLDRLDLGVYHRNVDSQKWTDASGGSWTADHDLSCGDPSTQRPMKFDVYDDQATRIANTFFLCKDHLMSSVGDVDGYSIAWFSPKQTFQGGVHTQVSFDVNVTDLGARQWWEVSLVPIGSPFLATVDWVAHPANIDAYDDKTVVVGKGPLGNDGNIVTQGAFRDPLDWQHVCGLGALDPEGCASKAIRRTFTITDNRNGTISFDYLGQRYTYPGEFPSEFRVYFKDHNYTPDKDGVPVGHTWHWDNIIVQ